MTIRLSRGTPREFAGLYVDDADVDAILSELPGLDGPTPAEQETLRRGFSGMVEAARGALLASLDGESVFARIVRSCGLDPEDVEVLALLAAVELDDRRQRLLAYVQDSVQLPRATLAGLERCFPPPHRGSRAVAPASQLARAGLVEVEETGPWATRQASLAARVAWAFAGDDSPGPGLHPDATMMRPASVDARGESLVLVVGPDRAARLSTAFERCEGTDFLVSPSPDEQAGWLALIREATVSGLTPVIEVEGDLSADSRHHIRIADHLAWAISSPVELALESLPDRRWVEVRTPAGTVSEEEWGQAFGGDQVVTHPLTKEQLRLVAMAAPALGGDVEAAVRRLASGHLDRMARRVRPSRRWTDLVLPADQLEQLHELASRYRHRSTVHDGWGFPVHPSAGLVALFSGSSGTGKTLAAEVVAHDLGLDLYKVDLSSVVSKYIGETEKNLERIFSAASAGSVVLFFDEADALFGKRSDVSDAHDRYANIEVSYLLQRLESYGGIVVMATNLQRNMDSAFLRRIHVSVEFPLPEEAQRRAIWRLSFTNGAPIEDVDVDFLARQFKISGGSIRNAALTAAFLAAEAGSPITMELVILGLKREFQKLGRLRTEADFERYIELVRGEPDVAPVG